MTKRSFTGKMRGSTLTIALALWEGGMWSTDELAQRAGVSHSCVYHAIWYLRERFGGALIESVHGQGYRLRRPEDRKDQEMSTLRHQVREVLETA